MTAARPVKVEGDILNHRLIGMSGPIAGVEWDPPEDEQSRVEELFEYFASRRGLYRAYNSEMAQFAASMAIEVRDRLADEFALQRHDNPFRESLIAMHAACDKMLEKVRHTEGLEYRLELYYACCMGEMRAIIGIHIARLAAIYDVDIPGDLSAILPGQPQLRPAHNAQAEHETTSGTKRKVGRKRKIQHRAAKR